MRILMLTPYLPYPPSSGGQIRSYNLIKQLSKKHEITLCSLIKYEDERKYVKELEPFCKQVLVFKRAEKPFTLRNIFKTGFSLYPFVVIRNFSAEEKKKINQLIKTEEFDLIHAETFYVSPHIPKTDIPVVLVDQTIEFEVYLHYVQHYRYPLLKPLLYIDVLKNKYWETHYWKTAGRVVAVSESDAKKMRRAVKGLKVTVVPNGVGEDLIESGPLHYNQNILFMGNYAWLQNIEAAKVLARQVFPKILAKLPGATLTIAGQNTDKIQDLAGDQIKLVNLAIEDIDGVKKAYAGAGVLVAPLYGPGGTRLKILGAMSARTPVVTTHIGIEGIDAVNGESVLYGETPDELAKLTVQLLEDKKLYSKIAENARKLVDTQYAYPAIAQKLSEVYEEVANG